jgi:hypothetical protein
MPTKPVVGLTEDAAERCRLVGGMEELEEARWGVVEVEEGGSAEELEEAVVDFGFFLNVLFILAIAARPALPGDAISGAGVDFFLRVTAETSLVKAPAPGLLGEPLIAPWGVKQKEMRGDRFISVSG